MLLAAARFFISSILFPQDFEQPLNPPIFHDRLELRAKARRRVLRSDSQLNPLSETREDAGRLFKWTCSLSLNPNRILRTCV